MLVPTRLTAVTVPLVAVKLLVPTVPTTASSKVTVKVMASLVTLATVASVTLLTLGGVTSAMLLSSSTWAKLPLLNTL